MVITIIAVLLAIASVTYGGAQKKSRDARRIEDLNAIQKAMELAYDKLGENYPINVNSVLETGVLNSWPQNPTSGGYALLDATTTNYCVCSLMETRKNGNSTAYNCNSFTSDPNLATYYCVKNLQ